jgi:hypothetical protein
MPHDKRCEARHERDCIQTAGFSTEQVTALAELIDTQAASKSDLEASEHRLELKIVDAKADLKADIGGVKAEIGGVKAEIGGVKAEVLLLKWMMGFVLAFQVAIFAKLFLH